MNNKYGSVIWFDGSLVDPKDAQVSIMSHALHYGSSFFEGIRAYETERGTAIFRLDDHLKRLYYSLHTYYVQIPYTLDELRAAVIDVVAKNGFANCYIRPFAFIGTEWHALMPDADTKVHTAISTWEFGNYYDGIPAAKAKVASYRRVSPTMMPMQAKASANYMNSQLMKYEAKSAGVDEAIALDMNGNVSEASAANIFLVFGKELHTPSLDCSVLNGLTRQTVIAIADSMGYEVIERHIGRDDLYRADELFLCGTAAEITSVDEIDYMQVGNGSTAVGTEFWTAYQAIVHGRDARYDHWLTYVK